MDDPTEIQPPDDAPPPLLARVRRRPLVAGALVALLAAGAGIAAARIVWPSRSSTPSSVAAGSGSSLGGASTAAGALNAVAAKVDPGLVDINTTLSGGRGAAAGTGMVLTSSGEVLTNNHVISGATRITATDIGNGKTYVAHVVGYDRAHDVAVLKLQHASALSTVPLGDSSSVAVGAAVVTIGNAGGAGGTPSVAGGSVVALQRSITAGDDASGTSEQLTGLIALSGQLQPGDSGGPLVGASGKVIGMDTAASASYTFEGSAGEGFAVPINQALAIARTIVAGKASASIHIGATAMLGVLINPGIQPGGVVGSPGGGGAASTVAGAAVEAALTGSPAAAAGITAGDTITALGGHTVSSANALSARVAHYHPGDRVSVSWVDASGVGHTAKVTLAVGAAA